MFKSKNISKVFIGLLVLLLVVLVLLLVSTKFSLSNEYQIKIVESGSMEPAIKTGSIVLIHPSTTYKVGDVVTFKLATAGDTTPTTHRIIKVIGTDDETSYMTKGDANDVQDTEVVRQEEVVGGVVLDIPYLGYLLNFARTTVGFLILIIIPALMIVSEEVAKIWKEMKLIQAKKKEAQNL